MTDTPDSVILQASAVAIEGRALLIEGEPGMGKSSLALALIDRGAQLIGDDGVTVARAADDTQSRLIASAPPNIKGLLEVRGVGLVRFAVSPPVPVALILSLSDAETERLPETIGCRDILSCAIPTLPFHPGSLAPAERAKAALRLHGLALG
ncbi:MAG: HPr kinase/phosphatase C-terminal domain-containing protein [Pseudomonadota bacterium]